MQRFWRMDKNNHSDQKRPESDQKNYLGTTQKTTQELLKNRPVRAQRWHNKILSLIAENPQISISTLAVSAPMECVTSGMCVDQTDYRIRQLIPTATYRFNKTIATATIRFIATSRYCCIERFKTCSSSMLTSCQHRYHIHNREEASDYLLRSMRLVSLER